MERRRDFIWNLDDSDVWRLPLVARHLQPEVGEETRAIWNDRESLLGIVEAAPQTLCHLDLHPGNLFAIDGETVLIDWAFVGIGALTEAVSEGYLAGVEASGWRGDIGAVLQALYAAAAVKYFWILPALLEAAAGRKATLNGAPIEKCFAQWAPAVPALVSFAREV